MKRPLPPNSVVKLVRLWPHARKRGYELGQTWRIGYYSRQDGLDVVWLVDADGKYCHTGDHDWIEKHFDVLHLSDEGSAFGARRPRLGSLRGKPTI
jgi:hypothetical protein